MIRAHDDPPGVIHPLPPTTPTSASLARKSDRAIPADLLREASDRVAIMAKGKVVVCGTLAELRELYKQDDLEELFFSLVS